MKSLKRASHKDNGNSYLKYTISDESLANAGRPNKKSGTDGQKVVRWAWGVAQRRERACADYFLQFTQLRGVEFLLLQVWKEARAQGP